MKNIPVVANTILLQLGGNKFRVMTGANNFVGTDDSLIFRLPGAGGFCKNGINKVVIRLTPADLYDVEFYRLRSKAAKLIEKAEGVYCDQLRGVFERATGLRTSL